MGTNGRLPERLKLEDEKVFPALIQSGYRVTSFEDVNYNCIAHAAGDNTKKWDPSMTPLPGYYWPPGADRGSGPDSLRSAFEAIGYELCAGGAIEHGFDKVALYADSNGDWSHAAKQDHHTGLWSSKLGDIEDISHRSEHCFSGSIYGDVVYYMRRPRYLGSPE